MQPPKNTNTQPLPTSNLRWPSPWLAVILVVVSFFAASLIAEVAISMYPVIKHWTSEHAQQWIDDTTSIQFLFTLLAYALMLVPIILFLRHRNIKLRDIGLKKPRLRDAGYGLAALPAYFISYGILVGVASSLVPSLNVDQKQQIGFDHTTGSLDLVFTFISLAIIPPFAEEFLMRGFLFTSLRARIKLVGAVLVTSLIFAVGHLEFGSGAPLLWVAALDTFVLSLFLIFLRVKTGSLWASICLHAFKNSIAFVVIFVLHKG